MISSTSVFIEGEETFTRCVGFSLEVAKRMYSAFKIPGTIRMVEDNYSDYGEHLFSRSSIRYAGGKKWYDYNYNIMEEGDEKSRDCDVEA